MRGSDCVAFGAIYLQQPFNFNLAHAQTVSGAGADVHNPNPDNFTQLGAGTHKAECRRVYKVRTLDQRTKI